MRRLYTCIITSLICLPAFVAIAQAADTFPHIWSGFSTPLAGRSAEQRHNAALAGKALDGFVIMPGRTMSFNGLVGTRDSVKGYTSAPMIDTDGMLKGTPGGGICQLATTLYNAALLAGLTIAERHPHSRAVGYVPPGRDATIVSWRKDLKLANPHPVPLQLRVTIEDERLTISFRSPVERPFSTDIRTDTIPVEPDTAVITGKSGTTGLQRGRKGYTVVTRRVTTRNGTISEEIISEDFYPPPSRLIAGEEE